MSIENPLNLSEFPYKVGARTIAKLVYSCNMSQSHVATCYNML